MYASFNLSDLLLTTCTEVHLINSRLASAHTSEQALTSITTATTAFTSTIPIEDDCFHYQEYHDEHEEHRYEYCSSNPKYGNLAPVFIAFLDHSETFVFAEWTFQLDWFRRECLEVHSHFCCFLFCGGSFFYYDRLLAFFVFLKFLFLDSLLLFLLFLCFVATLRLLIILGVILILI